jgi:hypothetical protein
MSPPFPGVVARGAVARRCVVRGAQPYLGARTLRVPKTSSALVVAASITEMRTPT